MLRLLKLLPFVALSVVACKSQVQSSDACKPGETKTCFGELSNGEVVSCMHGTQTCETGGAWGICVSDGTFVSSVGVGKTGAGWKPLSNPQSCASPCNPDCQYFPSEDGGLSASPSSGGGYQTGGVLLSALPSGWTKVNKSPCSSNADCQFDSKCVSGKCVEFAAGESGSCTGVDLTVASACTSGSATFFPVCNRGTQSASSGKVKIGFDMNPPPGGSCPPATGGYPGKGSCTIDLSKTPIAAGKCINIDPDNKTNVASCTGVNVSGNRDAFINYDGAITECQKCNNEGMKKAGTSCTSVSTSSYSPITYTQQYNATCPTGKSPQWKALAYVASTPSDSRVVFQGRVGTASDGGTWSQVVSLANTNTDPDVCGMFGPSPCPKDLGVAFTVQRPILELTITLTPSTDGLTTPTVSTWQVSYTCVDSL